jgi:predicted GNAT family N-acyltransferase
MPVDDQLAGLRHHHTSCSVVRTLDDFLRVAAVRSMVYLGEQDCPFDEEFDGNDFCAMHILGWVEKEPAASLRVRFFADFAKVERLAVIERFRQSPIAFRIVRFALNIIARKGFPQAYGHARVGLEEFWARFGAKPIGAESAFEFSGQRYTEMRVELPRAMNAIRIGDDPMMIIRPEGEWDRAGVLERKAVQAGGRAWDGSTAGPANWSGSTRDAWVSWAAGRRGGDPR